MSKKTVIDNRESTVSGSRGKRGKHRKARIIFWSFIATLILMTVYYFIPVKESIIIDNIPSLSDDSERRIRCVLVTDLHSCYYGKDQKKLVDMVLEDDPDIIFLGGDIFDDKLDDDNTKIFLEAIASHEDCDIFYVTGNHEFWSGRANGMKDYVESIGITVLDGDCVTVSKGGRSIDICGVDDPTYMSDEDWKKQLDDAYAGTSSDNYKILLSHRPERVSDYTEYDFDLILSGHAHAGQILIPFINVGLYAPNQSFFAGYVNGKYKLDNGSILVVSRGLARESTPLPRFFNHPEIITFEI